MSNFIWAVVAILIVAWLLGLGGVFPLAAGLTWTILAIAVVLSVVAFQASNPN